MRDGKVAVLGAPFHLGQPRKGVELGPQVIRKAGLLEALPGAIDAGDVTVVEPTVVTESSQGKAKNPEVVGQYCESLHKAVADQLEKGHRLAVLGGDHSVAVGSISGVLKKYPEASVIWVDAHTDINTPFTSDTGNMHGMPVAFLVEGIFDYSFLPSFGWLKPCLPANRIAFIGSRDVDAGEKKLLAEHNILYFGMDKIRELGMAEVIRQALQAVDPNNNRPLHLSFDIDGVDPQAAPSTGTAVDDGISMDDALLLTRAVANTGRLRSVDMVEVNPSLAPEGADKTAKAAVSIIAAALAD